MNQLTLIACPKCKKSLGWKKEYAKCSSCEKKYPIENGVVRFLDGNDHFYENVYTRQIRYVPGKNFFKNWIFFNLVQSGILGKIKKFSKPGDSILDIGCAGGIKWLGFYAQTTGLDISFASLIKAENFYENAVQADIENLPFQNNSFDLIYGSYIFEHLLPKTKNNFLKEARRVLKPSGKLIIQFDTLSNNWLTRFALKDPGAYKRGFIDIDKHIGLEPLLKSIERLEKNGFKIIEISKFGATFLQYEPTYNWLNVSYGNKILWVRILGKITRKIMGNRYTGITIDFLITIFDKIINPFTKINSATRAILITEKTFNHNL